MTRQERIFANKEDRGWNTTNLFVELDLLLGEIDELREAMIQENKDQIMEELADVAIYLYGMAGIASGDLDEAIEKKMEKNEKRKFREIAPGVWEKEDPDGTVSPVKVYSSNSKKGNK